MSENTQLRERLCSAVSVMEHSRIQKLIRPGLHKFLVRYLERRNIHGAVRNISLFSGDCMNIVLPEAVSEQLYTYGFFEQAVSTYALESIRPGDTVLDIGAHFGYFSVLFSKLVGSAGGVHCFEPTPSSFRILETNASGRGNIHVINAALGATVSTCQIKDYGLRLCGFNTLSHKSRMSEERHNEQHKLVSVSMTTIDEYVAERAIQPSFMKLDTENFEPEVLAGGLGTIRTYRPKIVLEAGSDSFLKAANLLISLGYETHVTGGVGPVRPWHGSITDVNNFYGNVLFIKRADDPKTSN